MTPLHASVHRRTRHLTPVLCLLALVPLLSAAGGPPPEGLVGHPRHAVEAEPVVFDPAALDLAAASVQPLQPSVGLDGRLTVTLALDGEPATIVASPWSLRAPGFRVLVANSVGEHAFEVPSPAPRTWRGSVQGRAGSVATLSFAEGRLEGVIRIDGQTWGVQPLSDAIPSAAAGLHVVYRSEQIVAPPHECGGSPLPEGIDQELMAEGGPASAGNCDNLCQIAIDADVEYYLANGSSVAGTVADIETVMAAVEAIFANDVAVTYQITQIRVWTTEPDPYTSTSAGTLLNEFRTWWNANESAVVRDVAHLFTGKNLNGTTIGIAYLSAICNLPSAYGLTQGKWSSNLVLRTATVAHELGHNWSAPHCNSDPACAIMCSGIGGCTGQTTFFEPGTKNKIVGFRNAIGCLGPGPQAPPIAKDDLLYAAADAVEVLDVLANDIELNCEALTIAGVPAQTAAGALLTVCEACSSSGGPAVLYHAPAGFLGADAFQYTALDSAGNGDQAAVQVNVYALRPPDATPPTSPGVATAVYLLPPLVQLPDFSQFTPAFPFVFGLIFFPATSGEVFISGQSDHVGAVFTGYLEAPASDLYTLYLESDDGSRLWIGDTLVVDNDGLHGMVEVSGAIGLQAGRHRVRVEYWEATGAAGIIASWKSTSLPKGIIPAARWSHVVPGDLNGDQKINGADLGVLLSQWGSAGFADLDGSGEVDGADLGLLLGAWKP